MYDQVLKFGAYIVDGLRAYKQPVLVYIPPHAELRGGSWVVIDPTINPRHMEMYADRNSRWVGLEEGPIQYHLYQTTFAHLNHSRLQWWCFGARRHSGDQIQKEGPGKDHEKSGSSLHKPGWKTGWVLHFNSNYSPLRVYMPPSALSSFSKKEQYIRWEHVCFHCRSLVGVDCSSSPRSLGRRVNHSLLRSITSSPVSPAQPIDFPLSSEQLWSNAVLGLVLWANWWNGGLLRMVWEIADWNWQKSVFGDSSQGFWGSFKTKCC